MADNLAAAFQKLDPSSSKRQRITPEQRVARLQAQLAQAKTRLQKRDRQTETREKIIIGGAVIKAMRTNDAFRWQITALLQADVTREIDREVIAPWLSATSTQR